MPSCETRKRCLGFSISQRIRSLRALQIFAIFINFFFPAIALAVVGTRAAGRLATNQFGWDDWLVSIAMLMSVASLPAARVPNSSRPES